MNNNEIYDDDFDNDFDEADGDTEPTLDELIEEHRQAQVEYDDWYEFTLEDWTERLAELGYTDAKIQFSGFWSQGDGAGFESGYDIDKFIDKNKALVIQWLFPNISGGIEDLKNYMGIYIKHSGSYCHKHSFTLHVDIEGDPEFISTEKLEEIADSIHEIIENERLDLCDQIYKDLNEQYDYLTSDEGVKEFLISNDLWKEEPEAEPMRKAA